MQWGFVYNVTLNKSIQREKILHVQKQQDMQAVWMFLSELDLHLQIVLLEFLHVYHRTSEEYGI